MDLHISLLSVLEFFLPTLFTFWPVLLIAPLNWKRRSINHILFVWGFLLLVRASLFFLDGEGISFIPEPLSTILFMFAGLLLLGVAVVKRKRLADLQNKIHNSIINVHDFHKLKPDEFELFVARIFRSMGHSVSLMGGQSDHGVDLTVRTKKGEKWIVQCKNWEGSVGEPTIRDLYGVLHHLGADRAALITSGTFSNQAVQWAKGKPIDLITGQRLLEIWRRVNKT